MIIKGWELAEAVEAVLDKVLIHSSNNISNHSTSLNQAIRIKERELEMKEEKNEK